MTDYFPFFFLRQRNGKQVGRLFSVALYIFNFVGKKLTENAQVVSGNSKKENEFESAITESRAVTVEKANVLKNEVSNQCLHEKNFSKKSNRGRLFF